MTTTVSLQPMAKRQCPNSSKTIKYCKPDDALMPLKFPILTGVRCLCSIAFVAVCAHVIDSSSFSLLPMLLSLLEPLRQIQFW